MIVSLACMTAAMLPDIVYPFSERYHVSAGNVGRSLTSTIREPRLAQAYPLAGVAAAL